MTPEDPMVAQMWEQDRASRSLGMVVRQAGDGTAQIAMTVRDDMINGWDICHGGLIAALADSAFAAACNSRGVVTVASGFTVDFLDSAAVGDVLVAQAAERALRGRSGIYDVTVIREGDDRTIAEFRGRSRAVPRSNEVRG